MDIRIKKDERGKIILFGDIRSTNIFCLSPLGIWRYPAVNSESELRLLPFNREIEVE